MLSVFTRADCGSSGARRAAVSLLMAELIKEGDQPATVAKVIVAAAPTEAETPIYRRPKGRTRQHTSPHRPSPGLRQTDPQTQPASQLTPTRRTRPPRPA
jgi:hypothetical protein